MDKKNVKRVHVFITDKEPGSGCYIRKRNLDAGWKIMREGNSTITWCKEEQ
jgi:hypothetical protein